MEKLVLALVFTAKRLRRYFQAHPIAVITDQPIKQIISRPDVAGRLHKWSVMLGEHNITYRPRTSVKGQILADFLVKNLDEALPDTSVVETPQERGHCSWMDHHVFQFTASNNEAEYETLIAGLRIAAQMRVRYVHAKSLVSGFANFSISQVSRSKNKKADALSKIASTSFALLVEVLKEKSIQEREVATVVEEDGPTWMTPIMEYLKDGILPDDRKEASKLRIKARQYELLEGVLYRWSFLKPWLRCVRPLQADYPTMHRDARDMIRKCKDCQIHRPVPRNPQQPLTPITAPWPFYKWGIDIAGPFPEGPGKVKFFIVSMDYFTKWIEAKAVATISGSQFSDNPFKDWCEKLNITQRFASLKHPQSNGLMERANRSLGEGIKARLGEGNKNWIEELSHAIIPAEVEMPTYRIAVMDVVHNDEELRLNLDLLEERRERATICEAKAKLKMTKYYNARVRGVTFKPGDFVYRSNDASHDVDGGKLSSKWEGPYEVTETLRDGA
ncbi:reverse transcriptase domain-containing protein [Tanacetum coccineum]